MRKSYTKKAWANLLAFIVLSFSAAVHSQTLTVSTVEQLQVALRESMAGDTVLLSSGTYIGNFEINHALRLVGEPDVFIDAQGQSNALLITASNVTVKNLSIVNWGDDLTETHAAIKAKNVTSLVIENNKLSGDGFGIYLEGVKDSLVQNNNVKGNVSLRSPDRGNGIHLINSTGVVVQDNNVQFTRDGLYIINSQQNKLLRNQMRDLRFGIHYMYSHSNTVANNVSEDVDVGYALMSSNNLTIEGNTARRCRDYGLLLNFVNNSTFLHNQITDISAGDMVIPGDEGKALFVYNATRNHLEHNLFANSNMGVHLTAGSVGNQIFNNQFVNNEIQVKYVATETQEWSVDGQGNYWSNYVGWDLNQDGIGDTAFEPNDDIDKLIWKYPEAKVIMDSPAVLLLRWVQRSFPILKSPGVKDSFPQFHYMRPTP